MGCENAQQIRELKRFFWKDCINETVLIKQGLVDCVWFVSGQSHVIIDTAENTWCELETWNLSTELIIQPNMKLSGFQNSSVCGRAGGNGDVGGVGGGGI